MSARVGLAVLCISLAAVGSARASRRNPLIRPLSKEASAIVAVHGATVTPADPRERPTRLQDYRVDGEVAACLKGPLRPPERVVYSLTAEGRPDQLAKDHLAFLRRSAAGWVAVEGPALPDTGEARRAILSLTKGCR